MAAVAGMRTLVVTNDFPPRAGGIQAFVHSLASRLPADEVVVYASSWKGAGASVLMVSRGLEYEGRGGANAAA